jgi:hypothetical protein
MRICSLLPCATEIVAELGLVDSLVGISEECDWPNEVRGLPVVTASRVDTTCCPVWKSTRPCARRSARGARSQTTMGREMRAE